MKRLAALVIVALVAVAPGSGQLSVTTGLKGGWNRSTFQGSDAQHPQELNQNAIGMSIEFELPGPFVIEGDVLYSMKGATTTIPATSQPASQKLSYIEVPLLLKYSLPFPVIDPYVAAGASFGILLDAKMKYGGTLASTPETSVKDQFTRTDYGLVATAGIRLPLYVTDLSVEVRYAVGLKTLDSGGVSSEYNHVISVYAGITL